MIMEVEKELEKIDAYAIKVIDWLDSDSLLYLFCERMPESISCETNICPRAMQIPRGDIFATHDRSMTKRRIFKKRSNDIFIESIRRRSYFSLLRIARRQLTLNEQRLSISISSRLNIDTVSSDLIILIIITYKVYVIFSALYFFRSKVVEKSRRREKDSNPFCLHGDKNSCTLLCPR